MIEKFFKNEHDRLVAKELANKTVSIILAVGMVISSFTIYKLVNDQRTVIVPTNVDKEFWVTSNKLSETYLKQMGQYISTALLTVAPNSASNQFKLILDLAAPAFYQQLKSELTNQTRYLTENDITIAFWAKDFKFDKDYIAITGTRNHIIGDKVVDNKEIVLKIFYIVQNGRFYISSFEIK
jgi:conjugal transfer pilus assembly protein TraE